MAFHKTSWLYKKTSMISATFDLGWLFVQFGFMVFSIADVFQVRKKYCDGATGMMVIVNR
jgi:hypothetical protein